MALQAQAAAAAKAAGFCKGDEPTFEEIKEWATKDGKDAEGALGIFAKTLTGEEVRVAGASVLVSSTCRPVLVLACAFAHDCTGVSQTLCSYRRRPRQTLAK